eukprot:PhM_4_TR8285/c2_g1_i1/m.92690
MSLLYRHQPLRSVYVGSASPQRNRMFLMFLLFVVNVEYRRLSADSFSTPCTRYHRTMRRRRCTTNRARRFGEGAWAPGCVDRGAMPVIETVSWTLEGPSCGAQRATTAPRSPTPPRLIGEGVTVVQKDRTAHEVWLRIESEDDGVLNVVLVEQTDNINNNFDISQITNNYALVSMCAQLKPPHPRQTKTVFVLDGLLSPPPKEQEKDVEMPSSVLLFRIPFRRLTSEPVVIDLLRAGTRYDMFGCVSRASGGAGVGDTFGPIHFETSATVRNSTTIIRTPSSSSSYSYHHPLPVVPLTCHCIKARTGTKIVVHICLNESENETGGAVYIMPESITRSMGIECAKTYAGTISGELCHFRVQQEQQEDRFTIEILDGIMEPTVVVVVVVAKVVDDGDDDGGSDLKAMRAILDLCFEL